MTSSEWHTTDGEGGFVDDVDDYNDEADDDCDYCWVDCSAAL